MADSAARLTPVRSTFHAGERADLCPVFASVEIVGTKWRLLVIHHLLAGPKRFNELLRANPGLTSKTLTATLKSLEGAGLIAREVLAMRPVAVVYTLTDEGRSLEGLVAELRRWGERRVLPRIGRGDPSLVARFRGPNLQ
jgi:DNA-binding HxlR family transcriptional regulator